MFNRLSSFAAPALLALMFCTGANAVALVQGKPSGPGGAPLSPARCAGNGCGLVHPAAPMIPPGWGAPSKPLAPYRCVGNGCGPGYTPLPLKSPGWAAPYTPMQPARGRGR